MENKKESLWTHNYTVLILMNFIAFLGQNSTTMLLQVKMGDMAIDTTIVGIIVGLSPGVALLIRPFAGSVIDSVNKKYLLLLCQAFYTIAIFGYAFSNSVELLMIFRVVFGVGMGFHGALTMTMAADSVPRSKIASSVGVFSLVGVVAGAFGPVIGFTVSDRYGINAAFLLCGVFSFVGFITGFLLKYPSEKRKINISVRGALAEEAIVPTIMAVLLLLATAGVSSFIVLYTDSKNISGVSWFFIINAVVMLAVRPILNKLTDTKGVIITIIPATALFVIFQIFMAGIKSTEQLYMAAAIYALSYGTALPSIQTLCIKRVPLEKRGAGTNTFYLGFDAALTLGPIFSGKLVSLFGYETMYICNIIPLFLLVLIFLIWKKKSGELLE